jgi:hypothetical protein
MLMHYFVNFQFAERQNVEFEITEIKIPIAAGKSGTSSENGDFYS